MKAMDERNEAIWAAVQSGTLYRIIAAEHGVTIERIRQIYARQCRKKRVRYQYRPPGRPRLSQSDIS
jgi:DNA-directed RNA polymerase sigma subunit (sigma70/sigma32)